MGASAPKVRERLAEPTNARPGRPGAARIKDPDLPVWGWIDCSRMRSSGRSDASRDGRCAMKARSLTSWFAGTPARVEDGRSIAGRPPSDRPVRGTCPHPDQRGPYFRHAAAGTSGRSGGTALPRSLLGVMRLLGVLALAAPVAVGLLFLTNPGLHLVVGRWRRPVDRRRR